ncbi:MAG: hypothetical protein HY078_10970 [Elusimicrobia bacterium]|nr:hypothetical protein [Elusimicrobiota bacterium]
MNRTLRAALLAPALASALSGCGPGEMAYRPAAQILPAHIKKISVALVKNTTQQFGIEDKLTRAVIDEFLKNGNYSVVPEEQADGSVQFTVTRYILTPVQYDNVLTPTAYKLLLLGDLTFVDRATNTLLWTEPNMTGALLFSASTRPGGVTEEQARELIYAQLAKDAVKRVIDGFGAVTGVSQRAISDVKPPNEGPPPTPKPVNPNPY